MWRNIKIANINHKFWWSYRETTSQYWLNVLLFHGSRVLLAKSRISFRNEPRHDKTNKVAVRLAKTDQPGHPPSLIRVLAVRLKKTMILNYPLSAQRPVWSESSLCAQWVAKPSFFYADSEESDQTGRMPRLIWVFAERTLILLVLSCRGSNQEWHNTFWLLFRNTDVASKG